MTIIRSLLASTALTLGLATMATAVPVDVELQLLIDVSGSVDDGEFALQRDGYINAFNGSSVRDAILDTSDGRLGKIAVQVIYWSGQLQQSIAQDWTLLDSSGAIDTFTTSFAAVARPFGGQTAIGSAISFGATQFANAFEGTSLVMDVSGDGVTNDGGDTAAARDAALALGIDRINGIAIGGPDLLAFYQSSVIGGTDAFALQSIGFDTFESAIETKLAAEISGENPNVPAPIPLPAAGWMMIAGLGGLLAARRRRAH